MFRFFTTTPALGIDVTSSAVRLAAVSRRGAEISVLCTKTVELPGGVVDESYASLNINDRDRFSAVLRECLAEAPVPNIRRAAVSLSDAVFRVQTLEFEEFPVRPADRERLIRWRLEKAAAFDIADTVLRYQVLRRQDKGMTVLACVAKQSVIAQFETSLAAVGLEPWSVGVSSFYILNFYSPFFIGKSEASALAHITEDSFATVIVETGEPRFYRYKEVKRGSADDVKARFMRELDDSIHFYKHMDRSQLTEVRRLYLTGEASLSAELAEGLRAMTSLEVEVLSPSIVVPSANGAGPEMTAAMGAGCSL